MGGFFASLPASQFDKDPFFSIGWQGSNNYKFVRSGDLELVCRFSDNFKECFVPFNSTEPTNNDIQVYALQEWALKSSYHLTNELLRPTSSDLLIPSMDTMDHVGTHLEMPH